MKERALAFEEARTEPAPRAHAAQPFRLAAGGLIDRDRTLSFRFDRRVHQGHPGDTLASALLANGVRLVGRSFKYHRPRGVFSAGSEEPSALVQLGEGGRAEPNTRATVVELQEGLVAFSQNRWPSLAFDLMAANGLLAAIFPAGFYYKTFMWPASFWEPLYERLIRRAAGLGKGPRAPDPDRYEKRHAHCDVLVVGAGPAGLAAALTAGRTGARVLLADESSRFGGRLLSERFEIDGRPALDWAHEVEGELESLPEVTLLPRTTAVGYYDDNLIVLVEQVAGPAVDPWTPRQRLWTVRAREVVLATGAIERPLVFPGNDRPGVMLAGAVRTYLNRFAVVPGRRAVVLAGCDDAWRTALDLISVGVQVAAIVDPREHAEGPLMAAARAAGIEILSGHVVSRTFGALALSAVEVAPQNGGAGSRRIECDLCAVSGGWQPALHLHSQTGVRPVWDADLRAFRPGEPGRRERSVGAAAGHLALAACLETGFRAGAQAAEAAGFRATLPPVPACSPDEIGAIAELWHLPAGRSRGKAFVDLQDDVTESDVALAHREGYRSVEHLKRYTTLGMGTDQGKTANLTGLALLAGLRGDEIATVGTTTFRPPYVPVALGAIAGREVGAHFRPRRRTPMDEWHEKAGAEWIDAGLWRRPRYYPKPGEDLLTAALREARAVRERVGLADVSTLGKIEVQGPDAAQFLSRLYSNHVERLPVGKARYGLMLREDGMVLDDGTVSRLPDGSWYVTTTTVHAAKILAHMEFHRQAVWPDLAVEVTDVTEQLAAIALAGPRSRAVLTGAIEDADVGDAALPFMGVVEARIAGCPVLLLRISFSGELAYEVHTPAGYGTGIWEALMAAGQREGIVPYGMEAMGMLRLEKGHVAGAELDGRTTPADLGLERLASRKKDYLGRAALDRPALLNPDRLRLVGLVPEDRRSPIRPGAQIVEDPAAPTPVPRLGHVTSADLSPMLDKPIALALISGGLARKGQRLHASYPLKGETVAVVVTDPVFFDAEGQRLHG